MTQAPDATRRRDWVPQQHGAWAMLVVPLVAGVGHAGPQGWHVLLTATWLVGYLAFQAVAVLLKARGGARKRPPPVVRRVVAPRPGSGLHAARPPLLWWAAAYLPLVAVSWSSSWRRAERSWLNDAVTVLAACLLAAVAHTPAAVAGAVAPSPLALTGGSVGAWQLVAVLAAYFLGTVGYVKSMIRERGNRAVLVGSVAWHLLAAATVPLALAAPGDGRLDPWAAPVLAGFFVLLAVRAWLVPTRWPRARPMAIGLGEIAASAVLAAVLLAA